MKKSVRNIILFSIVAISSGFLGAFLDKGNPPQDTMGGLGALIWLVTPLIATSFFVCWEETGGEILV